MFTRGSRLRVLLGLSLFGAALGAACTRNSSSTGVSDGTGAMCSAPPSSWQPALSLPADFDVPSSEAFLEIDVSVAELVRLVDTVAPRELAREKDLPVGAPGRATFVVRRGAPRFSADGETLRVDVPVSADIEVCKPLGGVCLRYGQCSPEFLASFTTVAHPDARGAWPAPRASIRATKRCVIGLDVTEELTARARGELVGVERRIRKFWPNLQKQLEQNRGQLAAPFELGSAACFRPSPAQILFRGLRVDNQRLRFGVGIRGRLEPSCEAEATTPPAPSVELFEPTAPSHVWLPFLWSPEQLNEELGRRVTGALEPNLRVDAARAGLRSERLLLELTLSGTTCGTITALVEPYYDAAARAARVRRVELDPALPAPLRARVTAHLEEKARWDATTFLATFSRLDERAREWKKSLGPELPFELVLPNRETPGGSVAVSPRGLVLLLDWRSDARIEGK